LYIVRGAAGFDIASLRQGDILEGVPFPLLETSRIQLLGDIENDQDFTTAPPLTPKLHKHRDDPNWTTAVCPVRFGCCAVLSNCCDLEPRGGKVLTPAVVLARLRPITSDARRNPTMFESLKANRDPRDRENPGFIDQFYLEPHELLAGQDWKVQFNQTLCLPTTDITLLLKKKILQLDNRTRMKFKIKLGFTFARANNDELDAGLENPWGE
jgi:hypothetical protein